MLNKGHRPNIHNLICWFGKKSSETARPNELILCRKHSSEILYQISSFCSDPSTNMAAMGNCIFLWNGNVTWNQTFKWRLYITSLIKIANFMPIRQQTEPSLDNPCLLLAGSKKTCFLYNSRPNWIKLDWKSLNKVLCKDC